MSYRVEDRTFPTLEKARAHAEDIHKRTGAAEAIAAILARKREPHNG